MHMDLFTVSIWLGRYYTTSVAPNREIAAQRPYPREPEHRIRRLGFRSFKRQTIEFQEHSHREERCSLIPVEERMVSGNALSISGCQLDQIVYTVVVMFVSRPEYSGFKQPLIPDAGLSTVSINLNFVQPNDFCDGQPARLRHFARSAKVLS